MSAANHSTAVIVTYDSMATIDRALELAQESYAAGELQVIVVDNASSDGTAEHVRKAHPWVTVIDHGENYGFARACNQGFQLVSSPYTVFLNPDAELDHRALNTLKSFMDDHPSCGVAAPAVLYPGGFRQLAGMMITPMGLLRSSLFHTPLPTQRFIEPGGEPFETNWLCGAAFMIRTDLYRDAGMMDPRYFMYFEETDLWRSVQARGYELWAVGTSVARHEGGGSARASGYLLHDGYITRYYYPSRFYYLSKHFGTLSAVLTESVALATLVLRTCFHAIRRKSRQSLRTRLAGGLFRKPKAIQS